MNELHDPHLVLLPLVVYFLLQVGLVELQTIKYR